MEVGRAESQDVGRALRPSPAAMWPEHSLGCNEIMKKAKKKKKSNTSGSLRVEEQKTQSHHANNSTLSPTSRR